MYGKCLLRIKAADILNASLICLYRVSTNVCLIRFQLNIILWANSNVSNLASVSLLFFLNWQNTISEQRLENVILLLLPINNMFIRNYKCWEKKHLNSHILGYHRALHILVREVSRCVSFGEMYSATSRYKHCPKYPGGWLSEAEDAHLNIRHCFRWTSATFLANASSDILILFNNMEVSVHL